MTTAAAPRRSRRAVAWIVVAVLLAVGLPVAGEVAARIIAPQLIRDRIVQNLGLAADTQIDVEIPAPLLLPLVVVGQLPELRLSAQDVELDGFTGDVEVVAQDVPMYRDADWSDADATVVLDETQTRALLSRVEGFPADAFALDPPEIALDTQFAVFGVEVPVGVRLSAEASEGRILLSPTSFRLAGADVSADALRQQLGPLAGSFVEDWPVCVAGYLPAAMRLEDVAIEDRGVVASFEIDSSILNDPAAQAAGACADAS
ncbi:MULTISPECIES: LmeA family phospholipid-binding protein [unclassified Microbacterium]|uniref:LmeA family phospholipid-binding protein n=1 Tax=unclassified Microbacterium TaxID=2609290 RepID=UPI00386762B3